MSETEGMVVPEKNKKIIVEIGTRGAPFFGIGNRKLQIDESYASIDKELEGGAKKIKKYIENEGVKNANVVLADAKKLPFKNDSVDEIIFTNVFGDPATEDPEEMLKESARALKRGGKIIITEVYSPQLVPNQMRIKVNKKGGLGLDKDYYKKFGLNVYKITSYHKDLSKYHPWANTDYTVVNIRRPDDFQLVLIKE